MGARKIVSLFVLGTFAAFEWSCVSMGGAGGVSSESQVRTDISKANVKDVKARIFSVVKKDGKRIIFPEKAPGRFDPGAQAVAGIAVQQFVFAKREVVITRGGRRDVVKSVTNVDGRFYEVLSSLDEGDNIRVNAYAPISIPLADIQQVTLLKPDSGGNVFMVIVGIAAVAAGGYLIVTSVKSKIDEIIR
jgi:hypothetical protein